MQPCLDPICGDRRQEIVFIGTVPMGEEKIRADLDACLVETDAFTRDLPDPFPRRGRRAA